jgi:amidohydrolase
MEFLMHPLLDEAWSHFEYTQRMRRDFHRFPELGFYEVRTAGIVKEELNELGLETLTEVAQTGVISLIKGDRPGPVVLLRFDMDALRITEETGAEYASQNPGVMHACGHDGHIAIGLTVARMLHFHRQELAGTVKLVFQPAEEGLGGAPRMIAEGVLENPRPDFALALHLWNEKPFGWVGVSPGAVMAAGEIIHLRISGIGGHGAAPHLAVDPVLASAQVIVGLQSIVSRNVPPLETAVVSITMVHGGEAFNIIPPQVEMQGTIRTFEPEVRETVEKRFREIVQGIAETFGCRAEIEIEFLTPAVVNDPELTARVQGTVLKVWPECELDQNDRHMGSEDMAYVMKEIPGCFFFVGSANSSRSLDAPHHHPRFDFDEQTLPYAVALMASAASELLR